MIEEEEEEEDDDDDDDDDDNINNMCLNGRRAIHSAPNWLALKRRKCSYQDIQDLQWVAEA